MYALHLVAINQTACTVVKTCFTQSMLKPVSKTDIDCTTVYVYLMLKLRKTLCKEVNKIFSAKYKTQSILVRQG